MCQGSFKYYVHLNKQGGRVTQMHMFANEEGGTRNRMNIFRTYSTLSESFPHENFAMFTTVVKQRMEMVYILKINTAMSFSIFLCFEFQISFVFL